MGPSRWDEVGRLQGWLICVVWGLLWLRVPRSESLPFWMALLLAPPTLGLPAAILHFLRSDERVRDAALNSLALPPSPSVQSIIFLIYLRAPAFVSFVLWVFGAIAAALAWPLGYSEQVVAWLLGTK